VTSNAEIPLPPPKMRYMAETDERFISIGDEMVSDVRELVGLGKEERVLDVGCGYGRLAHALLRDPAFEGTYVGFDILEGPIAWCQEELTPRSGDRMKFHLLDVANARYNPRGRLQSDRADFGVEDEAFDVITLTSVFTHLEPRTVVHYLGQIGRALAPGGRVFATAFLLDPSWQEQERAGRSALPMTHQLHSYCRYHDAEDPLAAIAYHPDWFLREARNAGFEPIEAPRLGTWCARPDGVGYQDVVTLRRPG
jgi:SAM-dependent methyltransferase